MSVSSSQSSERNPWENGTTRWCDYLGGHYIFRNLKWNLSFENKSTTCEHLSGVYLSISLCTSVCVTHMLSVKSTSTGKPLMEKSRNITRSYHLVFKTVCVSSMQSSERNPWENGTQGHMIILVFIFIFSKLKWIFFYFESESTCKCVPDCVWHTSCRWRELRVGSLLRKNPKISQDRTTYSVFKTVCVCVILAIFWKKPTGKCGNGTQGCVIILVNTTR